MRKDLKTFSLSLAVACSVAVLATASSATEAPVANQTWSVVSTSGQVHSLLTGTGEELWQPVMRGISLQPLSTIRTGSDGRATLTQDRNIVIVDPNSEIKLPASLDASAAVLVRQEAGTATYRIHKARKQDFQVITPFLTAAVKGTVFTVTVDESSATVAVFSGVVSVHSLLSDQTVDVYAGENVSSDTRSSGHFEVAKDETDARDRLFNDYETENQGNHFGPEANAGNRFGPETNAGKGFGPEGDAGKEEVGKKSK